MSTTVPLATRAVSLTLEAEVMADESGRLSLVASTDSQLSDIADVTPARLRELVAASRARLAEFERLADEQEARDTLAALLAELNVEMEEWDAASIDPKLREAFDAFAMVSDDGPRLVVVPLGQDPMVRLDAVRCLIGYLGGAA